jgi:hypothetical protein
MSRVFSIRNKDHNLSYALDNLTTYIVNRNSLKLCMYSRSCGTVMLNLVLEGSISRADHNTGDTGFSKEDLNSFRYKQGFEPGSRPLVRKVQPTPSHQQHHHTVIKNTATVTMHRRG